MTHFTVKRLMIIHFYLFSSAAVAATVVVADKFKFNQHDTSSHHHAEYRSKHIKWVQVFQYGTIVRAIFQGSKILFNLYIAKK